MTIFSAFLPLIVDYIGIACMYSTVRKVCHKYDSLSRVTDPFRENTRGGYRELHLPGPEATVPSLWAPAARPLPLGGHLLSTVHLGLCSLGPFWIGSIFAQFSDLPRKQNWTNGRLCFPIFPLPRADAFATAPENWNERGRTEPQV